MAKLIIERFEERVLFPCFPVKHYRIHCHLLTSDGKKHKTYCDVSKEDCSSEFDFTCFDNADIDEFDYKNKYAMSEMVIRWCKDKIR